MSPSPGRPGFPRGGRRLGLALAVSLVASLLPLTVTAAAANHFQVVASLPAGGWVAGASYEFTVYALNPDGGRDTAYTGRVGFTSTDGAATLPANYTFGLADHGARTFTATLRTAGSRTIGAQQVDGAFWGVSDPITVVAAAPHHLAFQQWPSSGVAGVPLPRQPFIAVQDAFGNVVTTATTQVQLGLNIGPGTLSCTGGTNIPTVSGVAWFDGCAVSLPGSYQLRAAAPGFAPIIGYYFTVTAGPSASRFVFTGDPAATSGIAYGSVVWATRPDGFVDTGYRGTVRFASTDPSALLPADYTFTAADAGIHSFTITFATAGIQTYTVTDVASPAVTGTSPSISVAASSGPGSPATLGLTAAPTLISYGGSTALSLAFSSGGSGATVALFRMDPDAADWARTQTLVADASGRVTFAWSPAFTATYVATCEAACPGGSTLSSNLVVVSVRHVVSLAPAVAGYRVVRAGTRLTYTATVSPVVATALPQVTFLVYQKRGGRWVYVTEATRRVNAGGVATFARTWSTRGDWYVRARIPTTAYNASAFSPLRLIRVT